MKKIAVFVLILSLLMAGCAPKSAADNGTSQSSPAAGPAASPVPSPTPTPKPMSPEVQALQEENEQIWIEKHLRSWMVGRLIIPEADINVAMFIHGEGSTAAEVRQNVCDGEDSAILYNDGVGNVVADHNNQGFVNLPKVEVGDKAYIVAGDVIVTLECDLVCDGTNTGEGILDDKGRWVTAEEDYVFYTCGEDWVNIKIAGFKEVDEDFFQVETPSWLLEADEAQSSDEKDAYLDKYLD